MEGLTLVFVFVSVVGGLMRVFRAVREALGA